jgi:hypothetical protein
MVTPHSGSHQIREERASLDASDQINELLDPSEGLGCGFGYCVGLTKIHNLRHKNRLRNKHGERVEYSVFDRDSRADALRDFRARGISNISARARLKQIEGQVVEASIKIFASRKNLSLSEKIELAGPTAVALLMKRLDINESKAQGYLDAHLAREMFKEGKIDHYGRKTDEVYQVAFEATNEVLVTSGDFSEGYAQI